MHIFVRISTTRDSRYDWCELKEDDRYLFYGKKNNAYMPLLSLCCVCQLCLFDCIPCYVGVPDVIVMTINSEIIAIGEVSHDKPKDGLYQLLGAMLRVYLENGFLPCGIYSAHCIIFIDIIYRNFICQ